MIQINRAGVENAGKLVALNALAWNPWESDWRETLPPLTASIALTIMAFSRAFVDLSRCRSWEREDYGANYITRCVNCFFPHFLN